MLAPMEKHATFMHGDTGDATQKHRVPIPQLRFTHAVPSLVGQQANDVRRSGCWLSGIGADGGDHTAAMLVSCRG